MPVLRKAALEDYEQILRMKLQVHNLHVNAKPEFYKSVEVPLSFQQYQADLENGAVAYFVLCDNDMVLKRWRSGLRRSKPAMERLNSRCCRQGCGRISKVSLKP